MRNLLKQSIGKEKVSYDSIDIEKAIKILFMKFSFLMLDTLTLEIPEILLFNPEVQQAAREKFQKTIDLSYQIFQKYHHGYVSPQQRYSQAFQDLKNLTLLVLGEYLAYSSHKVSAPERVLQELSLIPDFLAEQYWRAQDATLESMEEMMKQFFEEHLRSANGNEIPPHKLRGREFRMQLLPLVHGDILYDLEIKKLVYETEQGQREYRDTNSNQRVNLRDLLRQINVILHRPKILEDLLKVEFQKVFPLEIALKVVDSFENYLKNCSPIQMHLIEYDSLRPRIDLFRYLLHTYYYRPFTKIGLPQLRSAILRANLDPQTLDQIICDPHEIIGNNTIGIEPLQLKPLLRKDESIYINGSMLWESFLCHIDEIFKTPAFGQFKGHILEMETAHILYTYDLQPYNIILSNHPAADSNPGYQALLRRDDYPLDARYRKVYKSPRRVHVTFTEAPFFQNHSFVEFDICFIQKGNLVVLECKNQPMNSRRDRMDTSIFDTLRHVFQLIQRGTTYLTEPQVKAALEKEGIHYSDVNYALITPAPHVPMSMPLWGLGLHLEKEGFKFNPTYYAAFEAAVLEAFSVDPLLWQYVSPNCGRQIQQIRKDILGE